MSFMISSSVNRFVVGGERVERRVGVVLLADLGEQLEARAAVLVAVLHADLGEHAGHRVGADAAVGRGDGAVAALRLPLVAVGLGLPAAAEQAGAGELLDADGEAHVALAGLDGHDRRAQRGGAGGAGVGHVVDGDAGLADLLLELLADAAAAPIRLPAARMPMSLHRHAAVGEGAPCAASAARSTVSLSGCLPNLVMWIPRIQIVVARCSSSAVLARRSESVGRLEAEADGLGAVVVGAERVRRQATFMPSRHVLGVGLDVDRCCRARCVPSQSTTADTNGTGMPGRGERDDRERVAPRPRSARRPA